MGTKASSQYISVRMHSDDGFDNHMYSERQIRPIPIEQAQSLAETHAKGFSEHWL